MGFDDIECIVTKVHDLSKQSQIHLALSRAAVIESALHILGMYFDRETSWHNEF